MKVMAITISGFSENYDNPTGSEELWRKLRKYSKPDICVVSPRTWKENWEAFAKFVSRNTELDTKILVFAYSWGCGHGFISLANELKKVNRNIEVAILADPVYRSTWVPTWAPINPLSLINKRFAPKIWVPENVILVASFYQRLNKPQAHTLLPLSINTKIIPRVKLEVPHGLMDDHSSYHELCLNTLRETLEIVDED